MDTDDKEIVRLILNGVDISSSVGAPINVINAEKVIIVIAENTENYITEPELKNGTTYDVYLGGSSTGTVNDGIYDNGTYTPGIKYTSFTISGIVTKIKR